MFSDGVDTLSWLTPPQILTAVKAADLVIYGVELTDSPRSSATPSTAQILEPITAATGGRRWVTVRSARIGPLLLEALADMRSRYLLTYYPDPPVTPGWHELKVTLKTGRGDILTRPDIWFRSTLSEGEQHPRRSPKHPQRSRSTLGRAPRDFS